MGRTNPTYRMHVRRLEGEWQPYRRALRARDQPHFDRLFEHVDAHADAASYLNTTDPVLPALIAIALEQEKRIATLEDARERGADSSDDG